MNMWPSAQALYIAQNLVAGSEYMYKAWQAFHCFSETKQTVHVKHPARCKVIRGQDQSHKVVKANLSMPTVSESDWRNTHTTYKHCIYSVIVAVLQLKCYRQGLSCGQMYRQSDRLT